jgi:hypothetical protein
LLVEFLREKAKREWSENREFMLSKHSTVGISDSATQSALAKRRVGRKQSNATSQYIGVGWHEETGKWRARLRDQETKEDSHLGLFALEIDAAKAYNAAALEHFGPNAKLNIILSDPVV